MVKSVSSNIFTCSLCGKRRNGNVNEADIIICWKCVSTLYDTAQRNERGTIKALSVKLHDKGRKQLAKVIDKFPDYSIEATIVINGA